jgi:hypothetical protein
MPAYLTFGHRLQQIASQLYNCVARVLDPRSVRDRKRAQCGIPLCYLE